MEAPPAELPERPVVSLENDVDHQNHGDQTVPDSLSHSDGKLEASEEVNGDEVRGVLEVIASTGKFWISVVDEGVDLSVNYTRHDWNKLKAMLSFQLKQVLSEYPDAKMNDEEQHAALGETYAELVNRLDQALHSFEEGPPFTLQRLCEIRYTISVKIYWGDKRCKHECDRTMYANLSKLALALEKNLLVTSTLTVCTDPYPQTLQRPDESEKLSEESQLPSVSVENGVEPAVTDRDEIMAEVEEGDLDDSMTIDMEAFEDIVASNSMPTGNS